MIPAPVARLLHTLHRLAADGVTARVTVPDLAVEMGVSERRIQQIARQAAALALLEVADGQGGRGKPATYTLTDAALATLTPAEAETVKPVSPFTTETVKVHPLDTPKKGETVKRNGETQRQKGETVKPKRVKPAPMNDSYPEDSKSLSLKRTTQTPLRENHSLAAPSPFANTADFTVAADSATPLAPGALPRLLVARGFEGANVQTLARIARDEGADTSDVLKAMLWGERQEMRGRVTNWHAYLVACVKRDGWKACAALADAPDPLPRPGGNGRAGADALDVASSIEQLWRDMGLDPAEMDDRSPNGHR